jgi:DNA-binding response OmpR family regulator
MAEKRVLVVDYDAASLESLAKILRKNKFHVLTAADGQAGYEAFIKEKPDLVILEAMLPRLHGFDLTQKISRETQGRVPVILITGVYKGPQYRQEAKNGMGAAEYFEKPVDAAALIAVIMRLLQDDDDFDEDLPDPNAVIEALSRRSGPDSPSGPGSPRGGAGTPRKG